MTSAQAMPCSFVLLSCLVLPAVAAPTIVVSRTDDVFRPACLDDCSLREAIYRANLEPGPQRILLKPGVYRLTREDPRWNFDEEPDPDEDEGVRGDLDVQDELTLVGEDPEATVIQGVSDRLLEVVAEARLDLQRITLQGGRADTYGGAIRNDGETQLSLVRLIDNQATPGIQGKGGAIANFGTLQVRFSLFRGNNSNGDEGFTGRGGAIYNLGVMNVRDSHFDNNSVTDNDVDYAHGGAIYNEGTAYVARSSFTGNRAGEYAGGGGGAAVVNNQQGVFVLVNSTLAENIGTEINGVVANGLAGYSPSGTEASMMLVNVTLVNNQGLGLSNLGDMAVRGSIVAGNSYQGQWANCLSQGNFLMRDFMLGLDAGGCVHDQPLDNLLLFSQVMDPAARVTEGGVDSGTVYYALLPDSPAVDAGRGACASHDQRRVSRPRLGSQAGSPACDLGAFERRSYGQE